jgi:hypothetical protein
MPTRDKEAGEAPLLVLLLVETSRMLLAQVLLSLAFRPGSKLSVYTTKSLLKT